MYYSKCDKTGNKSEQVPADGAAFPTKRSSTQRKKRHKVPTIMLAITMVLVSISGCKSNSTTDFNDGLLDGLDGNTVISTPDSSTELDEVSGSLLDDLPSSSDAPRSDYSFYIGTWSDSYSQRCYMTIDEFGESSYSVEIHWSSSASMDTVWYMTASFISGSTDLEYKNGVAKNQSYDDNGNLSETILYVNGTGKFYYDGTYLYWQDDNAGAGDQCKFIKEDSGSEVQNDAAGYVNTVIFDTELYSLTLPEYWADLCVYDQWDIGLYSYGIAFYEEQSYNDFNGEGGFLFSIALYDNEEYMDFPDYTYLGELSVVRLAAYDVVVSYPTDVQFSDAGRENYMKLSDDIADILATFTPQPDVDCEYTPAS